MKKQDRSFKRLATFIIGVFAHEHKPEMFFTEECREYFRKSNIGHSLFLAEELFVGGHDPQNPAVLFNRRVAVHRTIENNPEWREAAEQSVCKRSIRKLMMGTAKMLRDIDVRRNKRIAKEGGVV